MKTFVLICIILGFIFFGASIAIGGLTPLNSMGLTFHVIVTIVCGLLHVAEHSR